MAKHNGLSWLRRRRDQSATHDGFVPRHPYTGRPLGLGRTLYILDTLNFIDLPDSETYKKRVAERCVDYRRIAPQMKAFYAIKVAMVRQQSDIAGHYLACLLALQSRSDHVCPYCDLACDADACTQCGARVCDRCAPKHRRHCPIPPIEFEQTDEEIRLSMDEHISKGLMQVDETEVSISDAAGNVVHFSF